MGDRSRRPFVMDDDTPKPQNDGEAMDPDDEEVDGVVSDLPARTSQIKLM